MKKGTSRETLELSLATEAGNKVAITIPLVNVVRAFAVHNEESPSRFRVASTQRKVF
jgi:hypothetical protein